MYKNIRNLFVFIINLFLLLFFPLSFITIFFCALVSEDNFKDLKESIFYFFKNYYMCDFIFTEKKKWTEKEQKL